MSNDEQLPPTEAQQTPADIWERMLVAEHKRAAAMVGMRVGDWEQHQAMLAAVRESKGSNLMDTVLDPPALVTDPSPLNPNPNPNPNPNNRHTLTNTPTYIESKEDSSAAMMAVPITHTLDISNPYLNSNTNLNFAIEEGQSIVNDEGEKPLPAEVVQRVYSYLDADTLGIAGTVSKSWTLRPEDTSFRIVCHRVYGTQSEKKSFRVELWGSWKRMLVYRPRVRTSGMYALKTWYLKKPTLDMWTELPPGSILEVKYYRYLKFFDDGRALYCLSHIPPANMTKIFREMRFSNVNIASSAFSIPTSPTRNPKPNPRPRRGRRDGAPPVGGGAQSQVFLGHYTINKRDVHLHVTTHYANIDFMLELSNGLRGHFCQLHLKLHTSLAHNDVIGEPVPHSVPSDPFEFYQNWDL